MTFKTNRLWCVTCDKLVEPSCHEETHKVTNFVKHIEELNGLLIGMKTEANKSIEEVDRGCGNLHEQLGQLLKEKEELKNKLQALGEKLEEAECCRKKLRELLTECEDINLLPDETKATASVRESVGKKIVDLKKEGENIEEFLKRITIVPEEQKVEVLTFDLPSCIKNRS